MAKSQQPLPNVEAPPLIVGGNPQVAVFTYDDVCRALKVGKQTVYEWVKRGKVPSPIYFGSTARFTADMMRVITDGPQPAGSYAPQPSPRAEVGKLGAVAKASKKKKKKKNPPKMSDRVTLTRKQPPTISFDGKKLRVQKPRKPAVPPKTPAQRKGGVK